MTAPWPPPSGGSDPETARIPGPETAARRGPAEALPSWWTGPPPAGTPPGAAHPYGDQPGGTRPFERQDLGGQRSAPPFGPPPGGHGAPPPRRSRRVWVVAAVVVLALAIAGGVLAATLLLGGGSGEPPAASAPPDPTPEPAGPPRDAAPAPDALPDVPPAPPGGPLDAVYFSVARQSAVPLSEQGLLAIGPRICAAFDEGDAAAGVRRQVQDEVPGLSPVQSATLVGAAVGRYCIEHAAAAAG